MKKKIIPSCPNCDNQLESENCDYICPACASKFMKIGETIFINETALSRAAELTQENEKRLKQIVEKEKTDNFTGKEGEFFGVITGKKYGEIIIINDFIITGDLIFDPILAIDETKENSQLLKFLKKNILERKFNTSISMMKEFGELDEIIQSSGLKGEEFNRELDKLIEIGNLCKIGTFHTHEPVADVLSDGDKGFIRIGEDPDFGEGENSTIHVLISEVLFVYEYESLEELGKIRLFGMSDEEKNELLKWHYEQNYKQI